MTILLRNGYILPHVNPHHFVKVFKWSGFNSSFVNYTSIVDLFIGGNIIVMETLVTEVKTFLFKSFSALCFSDNYFIELTVLTKILLQIDFLTDS